VGGLHARPVARTYEGRGTTALHDCSPPTLTDRNFLFAYAWGGGAESALRVNPLDDLAFSRITRDDGFGLGFASFERGIAQVQPEIALTLVVVRSIAGEAHVGKDGADVSVELEFFWGGGRGSLWESVKGSTRQPSEARASRWRSGEGEREVNDSKNR
jgi:hypothetical protein